MPFTFAHPAAVIPLRKWCPRHLNFPSLVAGSISPDVGYFVHCWNLGAFAHTFVGSVLVDIPISALLLTIFFVVKRPAAAILPLPHSAFWAGVGDGIIW